MLLEIAGEDPDRASGFLELLQQIRELAADLRVAAVPGADRLQDGVGRLAGLMKAGDQGGASRVGILQQLMRGAQRVAQITRELVERQGRDLVEDLPNRA